MTAAVQIEGENVKKLHIAQGLTVPTSLVTETIAILAKRGAGKTYTAGVIAEELLGAKLPVVVLDPVGVWWGLRSSADGKSPGLAITVLGGDHADEALEATAGKVVADLVAAESVPLVLDLSAFSKGEVARFVTDFAEQLYRKNRNPLHVIIDEADAFAPQKPRPEQARMLGAIDDVVRRGRARGLGVTLVTQRSAVLNKDVLTQCEVLIALRTPHPNDRKPIQDWIAVHGTDEQHREMMDSLAGLGRGEAWVLSAAWLDIFKRVQIRAKWTFDSSRTPEAGEARVEPKVLASVDLAKLREAMKETVERAAANDPAKLKAKVAQLEAELRKKSTHASAPAKVEEKRVEVPALRKGEAEKLAAVAERIAKTVAQLVDLGAGIRKGLAAVARPPVRPAPLVALPVGYFRATPRQPSAHRLPTEPVDGAIPPAAVRILQALARANGQVSVIRLATLTGYRPSGGGFRNLLGMLHSRGLIVRPAAGMTEITAAGLAEAGDVVPPQTVDEVRAMWREKLLPANWRVLEAIMDAADGIEVAALAEATGYQPSGGGFRNILGMLASNALITRPMPGVVRASEELMGGNG